MARRNRYYEDEHTKKITASSIKKALRFTIPYRKVIAFLFIGMVVLGIVSMFPTRIMGFIVDDVLTTKGAQVFGYQLDWQTLGIILVVCYALSMLSDSVFGYFRIKYMTVVGHGVVHDMRSAVFANLQRLAFDYYDSRPNGKILVRATSYLDELANVFSSAIIVIVIDIIKILCIGIWLFLIDWRLASVILAVMLPLAVILYFWRKALNKRRRIFREKRSNRGAYVAETVQGQAVINAFNREAKNEAIFDDINDEVRKKFRDITFIQEFNYPLMDGFYYIGLLLVYWISFFLIGAGNSGLTVGLIISFISFSGMLSAPLNEIASQLQEVTNAISNLESVMEVIETEPTIKDKENATEMPAIAGDVRYDDVTFSYDKGTTVLEHVSFDVPHGKTIALVGPTGAGKTTIISLLSRFYDIDSGKITIDGIDISGVKLDSLRRQIGVMMQDSFIFSGTIIDNIRYARPEATDEECIEAAKIVCADEFISRLPDGYYTKTVEQGVRMSTGERQLLSFARVILTDPKILILDEATASIDTHTEQALQKALAVVLKGRTSFVIAHRLSTIKSADCIFYIANKGIAEAGTHESLMEEKGRYYDLVQNAKNNILDE